MSLDIGVALLYNARVRRGDSQIGVTSEWGGLRAKLLAFDEISPADPVKGGVAHVAQPTPLDSDIHHTFELGVLLAGSEERHFEGLVRTVHPGDVWWTAAWEPHGWRTIEAPSDELVIHFAPEFLGDAELEDVSWLSFFAAHPQERPAVKSPEARQRVLDLGRELAREFADHRWAWRNNVRCFILTLLSTVGRESESTIQEWRAGNAPTRGLARIMPAVDLVHANLSERVPLNSAAKACGLSPPWFRKLFWETVGMTYSRFERRARLARGVQLLLGTDMSVEVVAEQTGFSDGSHFHRAFSKHYGRTPTEFRTQGRRIYDGGEAARRAASGASTGS